MEKKLFWISVVGHYGCAGIWQLRGDQARRLVSWDCWWQKAGTFAFFSDPEHFQQFGGGRLGAGLLFL